MDLKKALEFEKIIKGIKEVALPYTAGYAGTIICLYICKLIIKIPYLFGFILSSLLTFYILLISTYYFSRLYTKTSLSLDRISEEL